MSRHLFRGCLSALAAAFALVVLISPLPVQAHHGWSGYLESDFEITGTVEAVSVSGPHATMKVRVDGQLWNVVLAPPARTIQAGLKEGVIPTGSVVTAHGHRHQNAATLEIKTERVDFGKRVFNVYPERS